MAFITSILNPHPIVNGFVNGQPSGIDNRHGNIRDGGTISDSANWSASSLGEANPVTTIVSGVGGVTVAVQGADAVFNSGLQVINLVQTNIGGIANTTLQGGQSDSANYANTPAQLDVLRTYYYKTAVKQGNWNVFNGAFSPAVSNSTASGVWNISLSTDNAGGIRTAGTDVAANPGSLAPGRLVIQDGSATPVQTGYQPRYNW